MRKKKKGIFPSEIQPKEVFARCLEDISKNTGAMVWIVARKCNTPLLSIPEQYLPSSFGCLLLSGVKSLGFVWMVGCDMAGE